MKDTTDFSRELDAVKFVQHNAYLIWKYASIPNSERMKALRESFGKHTSENVRTTVITSFLALILNINKFVFNCNHCRHIKGCAMGTTCTPSHANIFIDHFAKKYMYPFLQGI